MNLKLNNISNEAIARDIKVAIQLYKQIIELAEKEKDYTAKKLFEQILADEEEYQDELTTLLEKG